MRGLSLWKKSVFCGLLCSSIAEFFMVFLKIFKGWGAQKNRTNFVVFPSHFYFKVVVSNCLVMPFINMYLLIYTAFHWFFLIDSKQKMPSVSHKKYEQTPKDFFNSLFALLINKIFIYISVTIFCTVLHFESLLANYKKNGNFASW